MNAAQIVSVLSAATSLVVAVTALVKIARHQNTPASLAHPPAQGGQVPSSAGPGNGN
jgi:hypothetical protein